jgi:hypothetical protein
MSGLGGCDPYGPAAAAARGVPAVSLGVAAMRATLAEGALIIVLVSAYRMFGKNVPHRIRVVGDDVRYFIIHDPWVEDVEPESHADAANLPIPYCEFDRMSRYGRDGLRAAVLLKKR